MKNILARGAAVFTTSSSGNVTKKTKKQGIGWFVTAFFIVADLVGGGVVAMPVGFVQTGLAIGIIFMVIVCAIFAFTGHLLGVCWSIMQERWEVYRTHCREPYAEMGERSMGKVGRAAAYICCYTTMFGLSVVYVLLPARILWNFVGSMGAQLPFCWYIVILCAAILPVTFLKSPADFWFVIVIAMLLTLTAVILLIVGISIDAPLCANDVERKEITFINALLSLGIFLFAFNGHSVFPTIQHDMSEPKDFTKSIILGFGACAVLYMPLSVFAFVVYGNSMYSSVIESLQTRWIRDAADIAIGFHCILTLILTINPINQKFEKIFGAPHHFGLARLVIRTGVMGSVFFVALSVPDFSPVMNVFGATTIPFACVILPMVFSLCLEASYYDQKLGDYVVPSIKQIYERTNKVKLIAYIIIIVVTVVASAISAYMAVRNFAEVTFTPPCYALPFLKATHAKKNAMESENIEIFSMIYIFATSNKGMKISSGEERSHKKDM